MIKGYNELVKSEVVDKTYLKIVENKTRMGPADTEVIAKRKAIQLSAAANRVRCNNDFTIGISSTGADSNEFSGAISALLYLDVTDDIEVAKQGVILMQAWDTVFKHEGTDAYMEHLGKMLNAQSKAYNLLGITVTNKVDSKTGRVVKGDKPALSEEQRAVYNSVTSSSAFDYYEYNLSFKSAGIRKFVRSATYRSMVPLELASIVKKLNNAYARLEPQIEISVKKSN